MGRPLWLSSLDDEMDDEVPLVWNLRVTTQVGTPLEAVGLGPPHLLSWEPSSPPYPTVGGPSPSPDAPPSLPQARPVFSARLECPGHPLPGNKGHSTPHQSHFSWSWEAGPGGTGPLHSHLTQGYVSLLLPLELDLLGSGILSRFYQAHQIPNYLLILGSPVPKP